MPDRRKPFTETNRDLLANCPWSQQLPTLLKIQYICNHSFSKWYGKLSCGAGNASTSSLKYIYIIHSRSLKTNACIHRWLSIRHMMHMMYIYICILDISDINCVRIILNNIFVDTHSILLLPKFDILWTSENNFPYFANLFTYIDTCNFLLIEVN